MIYPLSSIRLSQIFGLLFFFASTATLVEASTAPSTPVPGSPYTFLGWRRSFDDYGYINPVVYPFGGYHTTFRECVSLCEAGSYNVVAWSRYFSLQVQMECLCGSQPVPDATLLTTADEDSEGAYEIHTTGSTFSFVQCGPLEGLNFQSQPLEADNLRYCFDWCRRYKYTAFSFQGRYCGNTLSAAPFESCSQYGADYQYFSHSADATASGLIRRRRNLILDTSHDDPNLKLCPAGTSACLVEGGKEGYECLDVEEELESCGGCLEGKSAIGGTNAPVGRDCSLISGVTLGGVTCNQGTCEISSCSEGWILRDGECVVASRSSSK